jgi:hypothetical protein
MEILQGLRSFLCEVVADGEKSIGASPRDDAANRLMQSNEPNNSHTLGEHQQLFRSRERVCTHVVDGRIRDFRAIPVDFARIPCFLSGLHSPPVGGRNAHSYRADTEVSAQLRWNLSGTFTIFRFHHPKF